MVNIKVPQHYTITVPRYRQSTFLKDHKDYFMVL